MYIPVILGTAREGRNSEKVANFVIQAVQSNNVDTTLIDVRDYSLQATDKSGNSAQSQKFAAEVAKADALIIVTPEYNHSFPGELKLLLDLLFDEYRDKKVGFCTVSTGVFGGVRVLEQLNLLAINLKMRPSPQALLFPNVEQLFVDDENITDPSYKDKFNKFLSTLTQ